MSWIKPYLTFPFLWPAVFVLLIYFFTDTTLQGMVAPFLIPSVVLLTGGISYVFYYLHKHSNSFLDLLKKLALMIILFSWIPISIIELVTVIEVFFIPALRQEHDLLYLPAALGVTALNIFFALFIIIKKHKVRINKK